MFWRLRKSLVDILLDPRSTMLGRKTSPRNIQGDRDVEWTWIMARMPAGPGAALDFGNGGSVLALAAALRGFDVLAIDLEQVEWMFEHPQLSFKQCDLMDLKAEANSMDLIINCSVIEHVGLTGRYGIEDAEGDGDLKAMRKLGELLRLNGRMLMTIPVGKDAVYQPLHRIYGEQRLPELIGGFEVLEEGYWVKNVANRWIIADRATALGSATDAGSRDPKQNIYGLGCFVLRKS